METLKQLNSGETVTLLSGRSYRKVEGQLQPGDTYIAERNMGPIVLTVEKIQFNYVVPTSIAYCYDLWECVKVEQVEK